MERVHYSVHGTGAKTVVLLRGLGRWSDHWMGFENRLAGKGFRVITIDNRGFGKSNGIAVDRRLRIDEMADDVANVIAREAPSGAHVVGVSLGGMVGLSLAALKPQFVRSLMIVNSSVAGSKLPRLSGKAKLALAKVICGFGKSYESLADALLGKETDTDKKRQLATTWRTIDANAKPKLAHVWSQLMAARKFQGTTEMAAVRCPVTVVKSEGDLFVDPGNSDYIRNQIKDCELVSHPNAGHELAFDDPEWLADIITKQLKACP